MLPVATVQMKFVFSQVFVQVLVSGSSNYPESQNEQLVESDYWEQLVTALASVSCLQLLNKGYSDFSDSCVKHAIVLLFVLLH